MTDSTVNTALFSGYVGLTLLDYIVILLYICGIVAAGMVFVGRMKNSKEMFCAGGQSPWWVSGLSGFMTMFSAGTFVVWGGIAYRYGFVAVAINMCYGIAALLAGWFVAGRWRRLGVSSASEFLQIRFGGSIVQFYTWSQGTIGLLAVGGAIYALSKIICALIPLPIGHFLADPSTGLLSVSFTSIILCLMIILITFAGGLWAVLMTDVLQFVILLVSVTFVVPLILNKAGGWHAFIERAPDGFISPVAHDFTWWFLAGWVIIHFFKIGGEWAFVQRYTCVPTAKDARKAAYIFGAMYLISPIFWMMPPLVYRTLNPGADFEQAYVLACRLVLPAGMTGLMVAAMASATASMATTQLNVFAGAFTTEFYKRLINKAADERQLVKVGRVFTVILGLTVMGGALLIPRYGYTKYIIDITTLMTGPLILPTIWGLFSRKIGVRAVWTTTAVGFISAVLVRFGFTDGGFLAEISLLTPLSQFIQTHARIIDLSIGIVSPLLVLCILEMIVRKEHPGWERVMAFSRNACEQPAVKSSPLPALMVGVTLIMIACLMTILAFVNKTDFNVLISFAAVLYLISIVIFLINMQPRKKHE